LFHKAVLYLLQLQSYELILNIAKEGEGLTLRRTDFLEKQNKRTS